MAVNSHLTAGKLLTIIDEKRQALKRLAAVLPDSELRQYLRTGLLIDRTTGTISLAVLSDGCSWQTHSTAPSVPLTDFPAIQASPITGLILV